MVAIDLLKDCFDAVIISSVVLLHKLSKLHRKTLVLVLSLLFFNIFKNSKGVPRQISEKPEELKCAEVVIYIWILTLVRSTPF